MRVLCSSYAHIIHSSIHSHPSTHSFLPIQLMDAGWLEPIPACSQHMHLKCLITSLKIMKLQFRKRIKVTSDSLTVCMSIMSVPRTERLHTKCFFKEFSHKFCFHFCIFKQFIYLCIAFLWYTFQQGLILYYFLISWGLHYKSLLRYIFFLSRAV